MSWGRKKLQLHTYQQALKGSRIAQRTIMKMIAKREAWRAKHTPYLSPVVVKRECRDQQGLALPAMVALGIAVPEFEDDPESAQLEPWAVAAALTRLRGRKLNRLEIANIRCSTRDWMSLDIYRFRDDGEQ